MRLTFQLLATRLNKKYEQKVNGVKIYNYSNNGTPLFQINRFQ